MQRDGEQGDSEQMAGQGLGRAQKATALVPLALLSAAVTAALVRPDLGATTVAPVAEQLAPPLPDGTSVPSQAIEAPASVSGGKGLGLGVDQGGTQRVVDTSSASGIPAAALAAYQRAEAVLAKADPSCHVSWQLVAAIGRVESDHGRANGNVLDDDGVASPGIFGIPLTGGGGTTRISDSDAGQYDGDKQFDRAVGPMQFIPQTWSVVGVDADGDGRRDPQDVDDAALAAAVYLCSGSDDLSTTSGQEAAVFRYNHSQDYVDLVLSIMDAYMSGDYTSVPNSSTAAGYLVPDPTTTAGAGGPSRPGGDDGDDRPEGPQGEPQAPTTQVPSTGPTDGGGGGTDGGDGGDGGSDGGGSGGDGGGDGGSGDGGGSKGGLGIPGAPTPTLPALPSTSVSVVDEVLSYAQAVVQCTLDGYIDNPLKKDDPFDKCVDGYMNP